LEEEDSR
jgi:hypothetical protein